MASQSEFGAIEDKIQSEQLYKKPKKQMNYLASVNSGPWNQQQKTKYIIFIQQNKGNLNSRFRRREGKVFKQMSLFLGTRNSIQCRSHHQKQLKKFKDIRKIVEFWKENYNSEKEIENHQDDNEKNIFLSENKSQKDEKSKKTNSELILNEKTEVLLSEKQENHDENIQKIKHDKQQTQKISNVHTFQILNQHRFEEMNQINQYLHYLWSLQYLGAFYGYSSHNF